MIPLRAGKLPAYPGEPRFDEVRDSEIDIVAAQQDVFAHGRAPDIGDGALLVSTQFE